MAEERPVDFGTYLRLAREQRGLSLQDLAATTKISARVLEALEHNDPGKLPGGIFGRAFVRSYAREVGLDPELAVARFVSAFPDESGADEMPSATRAVEAESFEQRRRILGFAVRLVGVALVVAVAAIFYYSRLGPQADGVGSAGADRAPAAETAAPSPSATPSQPPASDPVPPTSIADVAQSETLQAAAAGAPGQPGREAAPAAEPAPPAAQPAAGESEPAATDPQAPLVVVLTFSDPCWLSVSVDGARRPSRTAAAGERLAFPVTRSITMTVGNAGAASLTLNDRPARALGAAGQVVTRTITVADYESFLR